MIKLILLVVAISIFGTGFLTMLLNQMTSAKNIIMDLYNSNTMLLKWFGKVAVLFSHPLMLAVSSIYIIYFIISKTIYS